MLPSDQITFTCGLDGTVQHHPGALLLGPPDATQMVKKTHVCDGCHERIQDVVASEATKIRELESDFQRSQDINRELRRIIEIRERDNDRLKFQVEQLRKIEAVANKIAAGWRGMGSAFESIDQWMGESAESVDKELCAALGVELNYG